MDADSSEIERFYRALFKHAEPGGWVNLRAFYDDREQPWQSDFWQSLLASDIEGIVRAASRIATAAANASAPVVFCPPVCTFLDGTGAAEANTKNGLVLLVDCDKEPSIARDKLEALLGPPTLVVASGGIYEARDKYHLYWRLSAPTRTPEEHDLLKRARAYGAKYAGTDPTSAPLCHPIRWPGSWHRKGQPRLARIVVENDVEVDLHTVFQLLKNTSDEEEGPRRYSATAADPLDLTAAMEVIPNEDLDWDIWNNIGMALWAATDGSDYAGDLWSTWSAKSHKDNPIRTRERWRHFRSSPPTKTGAGVLFALAVKHKPGWRRPGEVAPQFSDEALSVHFVDERVNDIRYTAEWSKWHHWTGSYWREDKTLVVMNLTREMCRRVSREANKGAKSLASARTVGAVSNLTRADQRVAATILQWNVDPWLLGTPGGTVDLKTGLLRVNGIDDYITRITTVTPSAAVGCPLWLATINQIFNGDVELIAYMQRLAGYLLTGHVREEQMYFFFGEGRNGKGTFIETLGYALGDYATTVAMSTLVMSKHPEHPTEIAKLCGVRLALASETEDGMRWNISRVKNLTGKDKLTARLMRTDFFDFPPTHKLVVSSNRKPSLGRVDEAIAQRVVMIPFAVIFKKPDKTLKDRLVAEAPGILAWAVQGCLDWQRWGLNPPYAVRTATDQYLHDQDDIQVFIDEWCDLVPTARTSSTVLYTNWHTWCERNGIYSGSKKEFTQRMMPKFDSKLIQNLTHFIGVKINDRQDYSSQDRGDGRANGHDRTSYPVAKSEPVHTPPDDSGYERDRVIDEEEIPF